MTSQTGLEHSPKAESNFIVSLPGYTCSRNTVIPFPGLPIYYLSPNTKFTLRRDRNTNAFLLDRGWENILLKLKPTSLISWAKNQIGSQTAIWPLQTLDRDALGGKERAGIIPNCSCNICVYIYCWCLLLSFYSLSLADFTIYLECSLIRTGRNTGLYLCFSFPNHIFYPPHTPDTLFSVRLLWFSNLDRK